MTQAERIKNWSEIFGHVTASDVWLFVVVMVTLIALVIWVSED